MTFLSQQSFDAEGKIKTIKKKRKILEMVESTEEGILKGQARVKFDYDAFTREDLEQVGNLRAAEAHILDEGEVFWGMSTPPLNHVAEDARFAHRISMASANIGSNSQRGPGNTVVCHPSVRGQVDQCWNKRKVVDQYDTATEMMVQIVQPYFPNGPFEVFENELAPDDSVLVIYRGAGDDDQPLIYVDGEGLLKNSKVVDVEHYGKFVRIP